MTTTEKRQHGKKWMPAMYVAYFGIIQELANRHGYALCVHGSVVRDFDLIAVPFEPVVSAHEVLLADIRLAIGLTGPTDPIFDIVGQEAHGRMCYTIECGAGGYFDISFTPSLNDAVAFVNREEERKIEIQAMFAAMN
ncbi:hypothetical protein [Spirosoma luteum]|uniref:hypothetical protein n=1 Tax=Spirosoma luteum TaxID=431553 RepID=UPI0003725C0C|nr:hypothetical protein [Spirosoma luteum]